MKTVKCFNNTGLEDFLVLDQDYRIVREDEVFYYTETPADAAFFKARFHGDTEECLTDLAIALDKEKDLSEEEKAIRFADVKDIIAKTEETIITMREMKKGGFRAFLQKMVDAANKGNNIQP